MAEHGGPTMQAPLPPSSTPAPVRSATCRVPTPGDGTVDRPDLLGRLLATAPGTLVLIEGGAGFGKTTLAAQWAAADRRPFAWVALDHLDDDPAHLVAHIAAALADRGLIDVEDLRFLGAPGRSPLVELVPTLAELLDHAPPFVLVLDDLHLVSDAAALDVLTAIVAAAPRPAVTTLIGRTASLRGTARRRLLGDVLEVRETDLVLGPDDVGPVFESLGVVVGDDTTDQIVDRCEGWPAGIHLAALALRHGATGGALTITGRDRLVAAYLAEEVLDALDPDLVTFLEEASLLTPMSAELLDEVLERGDAGERLAEAVAASLFLVHLDDDDEQWFRFHHLFGELLQVRMERRDRKRTREIHRRAVDALLARHDVDGAVRHAMAAGDRARATALIGWDAAELAMSGRRHVLARRLAMLDDATLTTEPQAAVARGWCALAEPDVSTVREAMADAVRHDDGGALPDGSSSVGAAVALLAAMLGDGGLDGIVRHTSPVIDGGGRWVSYALAVRGSALAQLGRVEEARADLQASVGGLNPVPGIEACAREYLAWFDARDGDLTHAALLADSGRRLAERHQLRGVVPLLIAWALDAAVSARLGDRARAEDDIAVAEASLDRLGGESPRTRVFSHQVLADAHLRLGEWAEARRHLGEAVRAHRSHPLSTALDEENQRLAELLDRADGTSLAITPLTSAERRVLPHLASHLSLPEIAAELHISRNTVKTHCMSIYRKMGVSSRSEAVDEARRLGLIAA